MIINKYVSAKSLTKIGKLFDSTYASVQAMAVVHLGLAVVAGILGLVLRFNELLIATFFLIPLPVVALVALGVKQLLYRRRTINDTKYSPEIFAMITDELRGRNITDTEKFLRDNHQHALHLKQLGRELKSLRPHMELSDVRAFQSLFFATDKTPEKAREAIAVIINERKIEDPRAAREMLLNMTETETPLMSGAL